MATISIVLRNDKVKKNGTAPLHFLIIKNRRKTKISTGISIHPKFWDENKSKIKPGAQNSSRLNSFLQNKLAELQDQVFEHETVLKSVTTRQLKDKIYGKTPSGIFEFADNVVAKYKQDGKIGTHDRTQVIMKKLEKYAGSRNLMFQDITPEFLAKYETHMRVTLGNKTNSIYGNMKFIRQLFNMANRLDYIEDSNNPFKRYKLKQERTTRHYLTEDELTAFENAKIEKGALFDLHKDMFVFAAYTGGLRISDVLQLKWGNFDGTYIHFTIKKTASQLSIKLPNKAIEIISKYKAKKSNKNHFIFPVMPLEADYENPEVLDYEISRGTAYINKNLKIIAKKAKIGKNISFHVSRHTWATRALRKGITIDKVSKLMGHSQIKETQIYAKIVSSELDKAMDVFNE